MPLYVLRIAEGGAADLDNRIKVSNPWLIQYKEKDILVNSFKTNLNQIFRLYAWLIVYIIMT